MVFSLEDNLASLNPNKFLVIGMMLTWVCFHHTSICYNYEVHDTFCMVYLGDTFPPLKSLLESNNVPVKLDKSTMYCMDNEAFRYLAALKQGLAFKDDQDHLYRGSWDKARYAWDL